jgi:hypothetical protein
MTLPPHLRALIALSRARVDFLMVGALALDHYMPDMASVYLTADCDILLRPAAANLARALRTLARLGYCFSAGGEPVTKPDSPVLRRIVGNKAAIRAEKEGGLPIDLMLEAAGFPFQAWRESRTFFTAGGRRLPCAALHMILESKRRAGREKDRVLLALYKARLSKDASRGK